MLDYAIGEWKEGRDVALVFYKGVEICEGREEGRKKVYNGSKGRTRELLLWQSKGICK